MHVTRIYRLLLFLLQLHILFSEEPDLDAMLIDSRSSSYLRMEDAAIQKGFIPALLERPLSYAYLTSHLNTFRSIPLPAPSSYFIPRIKGSIQLGPLLSLRHYSTHRVREFIYNEDGLLDLDNDGIPETPQSDVNYGIEWGFVGDDKEYTSYTGAYEALRRPSVIKAAGSIVTGPFCLSYTHDIRASLSYYMKDSTYSNLPASPNAIDVNFPYRAYISYYSDIFEFSTGRDSLSNGPGIHSLTLNEEIPYYDFARVRFKTGAFSYSSYLIRLNPVLSRGEVNYIRYLYDHWDDDSFYEPNASWNPRIFDQSKHYVLSKLSIHPWQRLHIALTQTHLIGGRVPQLPDFNPLMIYHNLYEEGQYSVPVSISAAWIPRPGIKLYGETLIYDLEFGNETGSEDSTNPNALAYQAGFRIATGRFRQFGGGYFRIIGEWNYVMPWVYTEESSYRNMSSRFVFTDPYEGRKWVDYPLGFYLGPDSLEAILEISYISKRWNAGVSWRMRGKGSVYLEGYGDNSPVANKEDYKQSGLLSRMEGEEVMIEHETAVRGSFDAPIHKERLSIEMKGGLQFLHNMNHEPGNNSLEPFAQAVLTCSF